MKTILIVDDEFGIVDALVGLFEDEGYRVVSAANGQEGLVQLEKERPNMALIDWMMPILNGEEMLRTMRSTAAFKSIPVILMSAAPQSAATSKSEMAGEFSAFLRKPFDWKELLDSVVQLIGPGEHRSQ